MSATLAQLAEQYFRKVEVPSSNLGGGSKLLTSKRPGVYMNLRGRRKQVKVLRKLLQVSWWRSNFIRVGWWQMWVNMLALAAAIAAVTQLVGDVFARQDSAGGLAFMLVILVLTLGVGLYLGLVQFDVNRGKIKPLGGIKRWVIAVAPTFLVLWWLPLTHNVVMIIAFVCCLGVGFLYGVASGPVEKQRPKQA